jgi:hypothetical protein
VVSEPIPGLDYQLDSNWGDTLGGVTLEMESRPQRLAKYSTHAAGADDGVAVRLASALVEDEVAAEGEADLGAVAAGAGPNR